MHSISRLALSAAALGGGLLIAAPASAQECGYPGQDCPVIDGGGGGVPATGGTGPEAEPTTAAGGTVVDARPTVGGGATLPFTGGEVTLMALAGTAAVGGGIVLMTAGRKRVKA